MKRGVEPRPKRTHNILAGGRLVAKFVGFKIEVFVAPRGERPSQSVAQFLKIRQRARALVVFAADCRLRDVTMAMSPRIVALAK